jgi:hypothetical protein
MLLKRLILLLQRRDLGRFLVIAQNLRVDRPLDAVGHLLRVGHVHQPHDLVAEHAPQLRCPGPSCASASSPSWRLVM